MFRPASDRAELLITTNNGNQTNIDI
uniref:Uncharacterized protein n=1 Tax=Arundo donax TaxID=35708 RepID=A0A0A9GF40_ARUDO